MSGSSHKGYNSYRYSYAALVKTVQMTLDADLVAAVDRASKKQGTSRSEFTRQALRAALLRLRMLEAEERHRRGYARTPVRKGEFDVWHDEQSWGKK